jgi:phosphopantetheinyl transferase
LPFQDSTGNKAGVNLTHSGDQENLSLRDENKHDVDQQYTDYLNQCTELLPFFDKWEKLARCRAVKLQEGSFFRLHRDAWRMNPQMRIFIPLNKTDISEWAFIYDKPGKAYILNTRKQHGSFSFSNGIYHVLMSVYLTENNLRTVQTMLPNCKDH